MKKYPAFSKIPLVTKVEKLELAKNLKDIYGKELSAELLEMARSNARKINAYKITYTSQGHNVVGFVVEPKKAGKYPCIISNRGGSREFAAITENQVFLRLAKFALWGYVVIASQYSGNGGSDGKDEMGGSDIEDVLNLRKILQKYPKADASRIGMFGASRGGMITYLSLAKVKWIKAAVTVAGAADETTAAAFRPGWAKHQKEMYGGSMKEMIKRSPLLWAHKFNKTTPLLIMNGSADWRVNPKVSLQLAEKLYQNKIPFRLVFFEGADHGLTEFSKESNIYTRDWFEKYVKNSTKINLKPHGP